MAFWWEHGARDRGGSLTFIPSFLINIIPPSLRTLTRLVQSILLGFLEVTEGHVRWLW